MSEPAERLRSRLRAEPPAAVLALPTDDQIALAELLDESRRAQSKSLEDAFAASLEHVPFPVRGIVKKVLMG